MLSDLKIAQKAKLKHISEIAESLGIHRKYLEFFGKYKAKISLSCLKSLSKKPQSKYVVVTAITPTPFGEGKTVVTLGLAQSLAKLRKKSVACLRQPSLGPLFGTKGGAAGGGYSQVVPMEDFNLHLTGDTHAVSIAHNLLSAMIDSHIYHGNKLNIDLDNIAWKRVVDVSDRALRRILVGIGSKSIGMPRETGYNISVASEVMAVLSLSEDLFDLRKRLGKIVIGMSKNKKPVTAEDLKVAGAMCVLLKDAVKPNILQTLEGTPVFVHTGPFANIAHGNNSIIADLIATKLADFVVTESGFGTELGFEKFCDIKCRVSGLKPSAAVLVCTLRALKMHGKFHAGEKINTEELKKEDLAALEKGCENLRKHIENIHEFGIPSVIAINQFSGDSKREINFLVKKAKEFGASDIIPVEVWAKGSKGGMDLAKAVVNACSKPSKFKFLYSLNLSIKEKIRIIASKMYGASGVEYSSKAEEIISLYNKWGLSKLPVCMAKTQLSLSHNADLKGRPENFKVPVIDVRLSAGAGFIYVLLGKISTMPGLPADPAVVRVDIDKKGNTIGLF